MVDIQNNAAWWMNEATSLLREARQYLPESTGLVEEIDESLPQITDALRAFAEYLTATAVTSEERSENA